MTIEVSKYMGTSLVQHLEKYLGEIQAGWSPVTGGAASFQVVQFRGIPDLSCFSTLGLSNYVLPSRNNGKSIRCELVMIAKKEGGLLASLLSEVGEELINAGSALLRGDVIGPKGALFDDAQMTALYATAPTFLPNDFGTCQVANLGPVVLIWLIPITTREAAIVSSRGWDYFEARMADVNPDFFDMHRSEVA
ncbi:MAG: suppressor of fused domain protein [Rhodanobacteraceae bacterium]|nr:suppressor of fused domain protein [Rhodanobacteraceae bacterium]